MENIEVHRRPFVLLPYLHGLGGRCLRSHCRGVGGLAGVPKWQQQLIQLQCDLWGNVCHSPTWENPWLSGYRFLLYKIRDLDWMISKDPFYSKMLWFYTVMPVWPKSGTENLQGVCVREKWIVLQIIREDTPFYLISAISHSVYYMRCPEKEDSENLVEEGTNMWNNHIIRLYSAWNRAVEEKVTFFFF